MLYAIGGGALPKLKESLILTTGPNVFAAMLELKTNGTKFPLLSSAKTAARELPWVRLTWLIRCFAPIGGVHFPVNLFALSGLITTKVR